METYGVIVAGSEMGQSQGPDESHRGNQAQDAGRWTPRLGLACTAGPS